MSDTRPRPFLRLQIPELLGGGVLKEADYQVTPGLHFLLKNLLGERVDWKNVSPGSVLPHIGTLGGEDYLGRILDRSSGANVLRARHLTEDLVQDRYDLAEALRIVTPISRWIAAAVELERPITEEQAVFLVRVNSLAQLLGAVAEELERPYRRTTGDEQAFAETVDSSFERFEDAVVSAAVQRERAFVRGAVPKDAGDMPSEDEQDAIAAVFDSPAVSGVYQLALRHVAEFLAGDRPSVSALAVSYVHTFQSAQALTAIHGRSELGRLATNAAGGPVREFAWSGLQLEPGDSWVFVVPGGGVTQS